MHWISPICAKCSSALVTALCIYGRNFGSNSICVIMLQHPWKIAWRLPFLPTHLISGHFLIGVHHVVQKWIGIGVNLRCVVSDKFGSNSSICVMLLQHPWKIAWRLPFLPTHLISDHFFLIGVHHVVQHE